ncbi:hypothetical protein GGX14DRAFT_402191 [Mycena pura]|uniref:Uncharacterized protein n=1 Tax=Mycena pura TaxID=153505 RepID=A0AAD6Y7N9_9AGAR|nr:hypothetical protein GGX14DRAFT_402191 [Mycena pura]
MPRELLQWLWLCSANRGPPMSCRYHGYSRQSQKYEKLDAEVEAELVLAETTGDNRNDYNDAVHRYANLSSRQVAAHDKTHRARVADDHVRQQILLLSEAKEVLHSAREQSRDAKKQVAEAEAALTLAKAEVDTNSSGRVPVPRARTRGSATAVTAASEEPPRPTAAPLAASSSAAPEKLYLDNVDEGQLQAPLRRSSRKRCISPPPPVQTSRAVPNKRARNDPVLTLDWECLSPKRKNRVSARKLARGDPKGFKEKWPEYASLVDEMLAADAKSRSS